MKCLNLGIRSKIYPSHPHQQTEGRHQFQPDCPCLRCTDTAAEKIKKAIVNVFKLNSAHPLVSLSASQKPSAKIGIKKHVFHCDLKRISAYLPWDGDLGLETGIWTLRLGFGPWDWDLRGRRRRRKFPISVKA